MSLDFQYYTFKNAENLSLPLLRAFINAFGFERPEDILSLSKSQLIETLKKVELARRPRRSFQVCVLTENKAFATQFFTSSDFKKGSLITQKSVETLKLYEGKKSYPYRTLIISPSLLKKFCSSENTLNCAEFLGKALNLELTDNSVFALFSPLQLFLKKFLNFEGKTLKKLTNLTSEIYQSVFEGSQSVKEEVKVAASESLPRPKFSPPKVPQQATETVQTPVSDHSREPPAPASEPSRKPQNPVSEQQVPSTPSRKRQSLLENPFILKNLESFSSSKNQSTDKSADNTFSFNENFSSSQPGINNSLNSDKKAPQQVTQQGTGNQSLDSKPVIVTQQVTGNQSVDSEPVKVSQPVNFPISETQQVTGRRPLKFEKGFQSYQSQAKPAVPSSEPTVSDTAHIGTDNSAQQGTGSSDNMNSGQNLIELVAQQVLTSLASNSQNSHAQQASQSNLGGLSNALPSTGFKNGYVLPLKGLWSPDSDNGSSIEEIIALLKLIKSRNQFRTDESLISAFLCENKCTKYLLRLTLEQRNDLDQFIAWLRKYREEDDLGYRTQFQNLKQGKLSYRSFAMELERLYRCGFNIKQDIPLTDKQWEEISLIFRKNIRDPRIKQSISDFPRSYPFNDMVSFCESKNANLRFMFANADETEPITSTVQMATNPAGDLKSAMSELKNEITNDLAKQISVLFASQQNALAANKSGPVQNIQQKQESRKNCEKCKVNNHSDNDCLIVHRNEKVGNLAFCVYCKRVGHVMASCWKLHGKPKGGKGNSYKKSKDKDSGSIKRENTVANFLKSEFSPLQMYQEN